MAGAAASCKSTGRRPNLLFLISDDHRYDVMGAAGNRLARTPNLDRLAREGTRFSHHYVNYPMCTPSRQSVLTGLLPHAAGVTTLRTALEEDKPTLAEQLKAAGYHTAAFGKMHFNRQPSPGMHGFDIAMADGAMQKAWRDEVQGREVEPGVETKPQWKPFRDPARIWLNADKLPYPRYGDDMPGTYLSRKAVEFLEQDHAQPFAAWVSYREPHSPFDFPIEFRDLFEAAKFDVPRVGPEDAWQIPLVFRDLSDDDKRGIIAAYYTSVAFMDRNAGLVVDALKRLGLDDNTLVVYWGDNGYSLGEHGRFEKHCFYEHSMRVPLMMRFPGRIRSGAVVDALTESVDITATILDVLGVDRLPAMHGRSLIPYLEGKQPPNPRDHVFSEYLRNEEACIRTNRWKLIYCTGKRRRADGYETEKPTPGRYLRLFDMEKDPGEFTDVASDHPEVVKELKDLLLKHYRDTHPEAGQEPASLTAEDALDWYLRPRDEAPVE